MAGRFDGRSGENGGAGEWTSHAAGRDRPAGDRPNGSPGPCGIDPLFSAPEPARVAGASVTFEPGARTNWHTHPRGQVLIVTEGAGFYQEKGKPAQPIKKGDVVNIPKNTEHWHGATAKTKMVHIAVTNYKDEQNVVWLKPVSEHEYDLVNKQ